MTTAGIDGVTARAAVDDIVARTGEEKPRGEVDVAVVVEEGNAGGRGQDAGLGGLKDKSEALVAFVGRIAGHLERDALACLPGGKRQAAVGRQAANEICGSETAAPDECVRRAGRLVDVPLPGDVDGQGPGAVAAFGNLRTAGHTHA